MGKILVVSSKKNSKIVEAKHKLIDSEFDEISESIQYLIRIQRKDRLFLRHSLNYFDLNDTISHYRNTNNKGGDIPGFKRESYPEYFFSKSFSNPFVVSEIERVVGNYLTSSRAFFDVRMSKKYYGELRDNNMTIFFIHHYRNYFQHQEVNINLAKMSSSMDFENKKIVADFSLEISKIDFHNDLKLDCNEKIEKIIRKKIRCKLPDRINVFSFINTHMSCVVDLFYDRLNPQFTRNKTEEAFKALLQYTNKDKVSISIIDSITNNIDTFQGTTMHNRKFYPEKLNIKTDEFIFLKNIFFKLIKLPTKIIKMKFSK